MKTQYKAFGILAASAVLAAGLLGAVRPAAASGLMHPMQTGHPAMVAQYDGNRNYDGSFNRGGDRDYQREERRREEFRQEQIRQAEFRRQQELRRIEERRREEWQRDHRQDFRGGGRHFDNHDNFQDNRSFDQRSDNR